VVEAPGEAETAAAAFLAGALERGHGALWLHGPASPDSCREALAFAAVDVDAAEASGALALVPAEGFFLAGGGFDLGRVRARWEAERARVAATGRGALFVAMEAAATLGAAAEALVEWEASFGAPAGAAALCQFARDVFPAALLRSIVRVHPLVLHRGRILRNHEVLTADAALAREAPEAELTRLLAALRERALADHALRASERLHRLLAENAPDLIFRYRLQPTPAFEYVSPSATALTGYTPEELYADPDLATKRVHPADREKLAETLGGPAAPVVCRFFHKDGRIVWAEQRVVVVRDGAGRALAIEGVARDVTERVLAQAALRESEERARAGERLASIGTLAAGIAHEVNNPLAALVSSLAHVREELGREPPSERRGSLDAALADALDAAGRVGLVVRGLRQFAAPARRAGPAPVDVRDELVAALGITRNELTHRARLETDLPPALPRVVAEAGELGQVFVNLLVNAAQAIPEGGGGEVRVEAGAEGGEVVIRIRDSGVGMPPEVLARACEPFFTTRDVGSGAGLGLAVAHGIVTAAGGRLELESAPGRGTCATVRLPAAPEAAAAAPPVAAPARPRVLVVDDEPLVGRSLARLLRTTHDVTVLESAAEAHRRLAAGERWDAVLCDLMMPELSGMDLEERLRADAPDVLPRIVYMTGGAFTDRARAFLAAGRPCIEKPVEPAALRAAIAARIGAGAGGGAR
jgi:PAS domain S-box-containing protein